MCARVGDMKNIYLVVALFVVGLAGLFMAMSSLRSDAHDDVAIAASFYPIAFLTEQIASDAVPVFSVTPSDTEPHDYELTPDATLRLQSAPLFIHTGTDLEPWANDVVTARAMQKLPSLALLNAKNARKLDEGDSEHGEAFDPHFWLSPLRTIAATEQIALILTRLYPAQEVIFTTNAQALMETLREIDNAYRTELTTCASRILVTDHDAFGYLADDYNLDVHAIRGISPDEEPSSATLATLIELVRTQSIKTIFTEELVSPDIAETIARETDVTVELLSTIEGLTEEDITAGNDYLSKLRGNLKTLKKSLACN